jgi:hypothetical protein
MSRWPRGEAQIGQLIANKALQQVVGGQANGGTCSRRRRAPCKQQSG